MRLRPLFVTIIAVFGLPMFSTLANAASCKECPSGCVAEQLVAALESDEESFLFDKCPAGCVAVSNVMFFHDKSVCEEQAEVDEQVELVPETVPEPLPVPAKIKPIEIIAVEPAPVELEPVEAELVDDKGFEIQPTFPTPVDSTTVDLVPPATIESTEKAPVKLKGAKKQADDLALKKDRNRTIEHRIIATQTAYGLRKGEVVATGYDLALWEIQYGVSDNLQLGFMTTLPLGFIGIMPTLRLHFELTDYMAISGGVFLGYINFFVGTGLQVLPYGGSIEATFKVQEKHLFNLSLLIFNAGGQSGSDGWGFGGGAFLHPVIAYRGIFHKYWSFLFELGLPFYVENDGDTTLDEGYFIITIFYGVRLQRDWFFLDFGFLLPASKGFYNDLGELLPLGFPELSLGFAF